MGIYHSEVSDAAEAFYKTRVGMCSGEEFLQEYRDLMAEVLSNELEDLKIGMPPRRPIGLFFRRLGTKFPTVRERTDFIIGSLRGLDMPIIGIGLLEENFNHIMLVAEFLEEHDPMANANDRKAAFEIDSYKNLPVADDLLKELRQSLYQVIVELES
jgi:hypothetical protein